MSNDPFAKLGALDQKLYQKPRDLVKEITQKESSPPTPSLQEEKKKEIRTEVNTHGRTDARTHAYTHTRIDAPPKIDLVESLYRKIQQKHHLSSYTFRYRSEELEALRKLDEKFKKSHPNKMSKNDLVRI